MRRLGPYVLGGIVGDGGMGTVYRATDPAGATVAVKILHPHFLRDATAVARFRSEAVVQSRLAHPHIVRVFDFVSVPDALAIVMEYVNGQPLDAFIAGSGGRVPAPFAVLVTLQILSAIGHAHRAGVIHRDVKPSNVIVDLEGARPSAKITDFGIVKVRDAARLTTTGGTMGTLAYMSPEHLRDPASVDARSDIYAIGATLYHLLTGALPFGGDSDYRLMSRIVTEPTPKPSILRPDVAPALEAVVLRAMEKDPARRYSSCDEMASALRDATGVTTSTGAPPLTPPKRRPAENGRPSRTRLAATAVAAGLLVLTGLVFLAMPRPARVEPRAKAAAEAGTAGTSARGSRGAGRDEAWAREWEQPAEPPLALARQEQPETSSPVSPATGGPVDASHAGEAPPPPPDPAAALSVPAPSEVDAPVSAPSPPHAPPSAGAATPHEVTLRSGTQVRARIDSTVTSDTAVTGQAVYATLSADLLEPGTTVARRGSPIRGRVAAVTRGGQFSTRARLVVLFDSLVVADGGTAPVSAVPLVVEGADPRGASTTVTGGIVGALIGGILGGKRGALQGAAAGAGTGAVAAARSTAVLPAGTEVTLSISSGTFRIEAPGR